jgi:hypothetical protein
VLRADRGVERERDMAAKSEAAVATDPEADRPGDKPETVNEGRRPRSELADLLAEALVAFESTEHAVHAHFADEPSPATTSLEPTPTVDRYEWRSEPSGSRHRQPEPDDRIDVPSTSSEPPMLSDWVLSSKEDQSSRADTSSFGDWAPSPFREERPSADRDPRPVEPERNWSDWTWTPPER